MLGIGSVHTIVISRTPTDMRKSFDGLCGCVEQAFHQDPLNGNLFVFFNRRCTRVKMLLWDRNGFWIFAKRLESGTFSLRSVTEKQQIDMAELLCILDGIELSGSYRRKRFLFDKK